MLTVCEIFSSRNPLMAAQVVEEDLLIITFLLQVMDVHISTCKRFFLNNINKIWSQSLCLILVSDSETLPLPWFLSHFIVMMLAASAPVIHALLMCTVWSLMNTLTTALLNASIC